MVGILFKDMHRLLPDEIHSFLDGYVLDREGIKHARETNLKKSGAHYWEPVTPIISQCNGIFADHSFLTTQFSREIGQFQST